MFIIMVDTFLSGWEILRWPIIQNVFYTKKKFVSGMYLQVRNFFIFSAHAWLQVFSVNSMIIYIPFDSNCQMHEIYLQT